MLHVTPQQQLLSLVLLVQLLQLAVTSPSRLPHALDSAT
jgi:hypothetical protein